MSELPVVSPLTHLSEDEKFFYDTVKEFAVDKIKPHIMQMDKEAGCFYHPGKKAVTPCSACGRFVCALCDVALNGRHLCPACFEKGKSKRKIKSLENHRTCYDTIALMVATVPLLFYFITLITAPLAIYLTVRHWNTPSGIIPRTRIRFILAFFMAGLQIAGWILFFSNLALST